MSKKYIITVSVIICLLAILFKSCELTRFAVYNVADVKDYKLFPSRVTKKSTEKFEFFSPSISSDLKVQRSTVSLSDIKNVSFTEFLTSTKTLSFLIIHNDTMVYEKYFNNCDESSIVPSFSIAKSVTSTLIGCAIDDGYIRSVNQPVTDFIPELKKNGFDSVTIKNLLQMTSGIFFREDLYHLFNNSVSSYYYGVNIRKKLLNLRLKNKPGTKFEYASGNAELLGLILERALKTKTVTQYLQDKIWQPLGMEYDASWSIDQNKNGLEKTFCCLNARARDYAKLGRLYLNKGNWNGKQIVSDRWIKESTKIDSTNGSAWNYQYQWWIASNEGDFYARGMLGQFVYVNPEKKIIIVRLGERGAGVEWPKLFIEISKGFSNNGAFTIVEKRKDPQ